MTKDKYILGDNCKCRKGYLKLSNKPKNIRKGQTYYFNEVFVCTSCKKTFFNESSKVIIGSSRDAEIKGEDNQLSLF